MKLTGCHFACMKWRFGLFDPNLPPKEKDTKQADYEIETNRALKEADRAIANPTAH